MRIELDQEEYEFLYKHQEFPYWLLKFNGHYCIKRDTPEDILKYMIHELKIFESRQYKEFLI